MSVHVEAGSFWTSQHDGAVTLNVGRYEEHADGNYYHDYTLSQEEAEALHWELSVWLVERKMEALAADTDAGRGEVNG